MNNEVDIVIRADGSKDIGMGHIFPMSILAKSLQEVNHTVHFISLDDPYALEILTAHGLSYSTVPAVDSFDEIKSFIQQLKPQIVINNTWQNESSRHFEALSAAHSKIIGFHQMGLGLQRSDVVINPLPTVFLDVNPGEVKAKYFYGPDYLIIPPQLQSLSRQIKTGHQEISKVAISVGGTDKWNLGPTIQQSIAEILPRSDTEILTGGLYLEQFFRKLYEADLAIVGGGNTILEVAFMGTPTLGVADAPWEERAIQYAQKMGCSIYLGNNLDVQSATFTEYLRQKVADLTLEKRQAMSQAGKQLVDGQGLQRITEIINDLISEGKAG